MAGLVLNDHLQELAQQRLAGDPIEHAEGPEREALDHDLHAEEFHVPAAVAHQRVDDHEQVVVDLVEPTELLIEVAMEGLDVPAFVHHLGRAVELAVEELHGLGDLGGGEERPLFTVEELAEHPAAHAVAELLLLARAELGPDLSGERVGVDEPRRQERDLGVERIDVDVPGQRVGVPLTLLGPPVELGHLGVVGRVGPVEVGVVVGRDLGRRRLLAAMQEQAADARGTERGEDLRIADLGEDRERLEVAVDLAAHLGGQEIGQAGGVQHGPIVAWITMIVECKATQYTNSVHDADSRSEPADGRSRVARPSPGPWTSLCIPRDRAGLPSIACSRSST